jgi:hypothetical protein
MRGWLLGGLSALMLMGTAGAAVAQETEPYTTSATVDGFSDEDIAMIDDLARQLDEMLATLAEQMGVEPVSLRPMFTVMLGDVFRDLPSEGNFEYIVDFDIYGVTDDGGLSVGTPAEGERRRRPVYADAQACAAGQQNLPVIRFERVHVNGLAGYRCIVSGQSATEPDIWIYMSWLVIEGPSTYLEVSVRAGAGSEEEDYVFTSQIGLARLDALNALGARIQTLAIDTFLASEE